MLIYVLEVTYAPKVTYVVEVTSVLVSEAMRCVDDLFCIVFVASASSL